MQYSCLSVSAILHIESEKISPFILLQHAVRTKSLTGWLFVRETNITAGGPARETLLRHGGEFDEWSDL